MRISAKQYAQILYELTDGKSRKDVEKSVAGFARYIYKSRKLKLAGKIIERFEDIYNKEKGIVEAEVISARNLESLLVHKLKDFIKRKYVAREVILKNIIDKNIKGGFILKIRDEVMDRSVRGRLNELKKILV